MLRLTRVQVREVDRRAIEEYHIPGIVLMENAGRAAAYLAMEMSKEHQSAVFLCGGGNNGGDGFVMARHLLNAGWFVDVLLATDKQYVGDALTNYNILTAMGVKFRYFSDAETLITKHAHSFVIDAMFGTGLQSEPRRVEKTLIDIINESELPVLSVDIPSGLDCDAGVPLGCSCVRATRTVTFVAEKAGFANPESRHYTGEVTVADIGCPRELVEDIARKRS